MKKKKNSDKNKTLEINETRIPEEITLKEFHDKFVKNAKKYPQYAGKFILLQRKTIESELPDAVTRVVQEGIDPVTGEPIFFESGKSA